MKLISMTLINPKHLCLTAFAGLAACTVAAAPATQTTPVPMASAPASSPEMGAPMSPGGGIVCNGAENLEIRDRHIVTDGDGIVVNGACTIVISNSKIEAGGWGLVVNGSGDIRVSNSVIQGGAGSVSLTGAADVNAVGSQFIGRVAASGAAEIHDGGGNQWQ